jgi:hypothetical protein
MENHVGEPFGILSMTTMHSKAKIKPPSLLPNHHPTSNQRDLPPANTVRDSAVDAELEEL